MGAEDSWERSIWQFVVPPEARWWSQLLLRHRYAHGPDWTSQTPSFRSVAPIESTASASRPHLRHRLTPTPRRSAARFDPGDADLRSTQVTEESAFAHPRVAGDNEQPASGIQEILDGTACLA
jgi:hypothetical protein